MMFQTSVPGLYEILSAVSHVCPCSFEFRGLKEIEIVVQIKV